MRKIKIKRLKKLRLLLILLIAIASIYLGAQYVYHYVEPQLQAVAKQKVSFAINNIVKEVLADMEYRQEDLIEVKHVGEQFVDVEYDSYELNQILYTALNTIDASLLAAQDGKEDPTTEAVFYKEGIVFEIPLGYLSHLFFLHDKGPTIPVRMKIINDVNGEIRIENEAYGVNSTLMKSVLEISVNAEVLTYLSTTPLQVTSELPLVVQIINGKVPEMTPYTITE